MKTKRYYLLEAVVNGNNSFDIEKDHLITEDAIQAMKLYANAKIKKLKKSYIDESIKEEIALIEPLRNFIRSKHLSAEWEKWLSDWEKIYNLEFQLKTIWNQK